MTLRAYKQDSFDQKKSDDDKKRLDDELTKALKDTFPASDPPALTQPQHSWHDSGAF